MQTIYRKRILFSLLLSLILSNSFSQKALYTATTNAGTVTEKFDSTMLGPKLNVRVNIGLLSSASNDKLLLILPDGTLNGLKVVADKTKEKRTHDQIAWFGKLEDQPRSFVLFTQVGDAMAGYIRTNNNKIYRLTYIGNNVHSIRLLDQRFFRPDVVQLSANFDPLKNAQLLRESASCCDSSVIDLLVVYTPEAFRIAASTNGITSQIQQSVNNTNESFLKSNIPVEVNLVHSELVQYPDGGSIADARNALLDPHDGKMDNVYQLRDQYHADIVVLIIENSNDAYDGVSDIMRVVGPAFESNAFCVVKRKPVFSNFAFAHEIGHILGARHECNADDSITPFPYSHGFSVDLNRTIMSENFSATAVELWSDPNINFPGTNSAAGSMAGNCQAADAECLRKTISIVAKFRCSQKCQERLRELTVTPTVEPLPINPTIEPTMSDNRLLSSSTKSSNSWIIIAAIAVVVILILFFVLKKKKQ